MDSGLKQRLIGAAVLIALAVIFLPMLVQGPAPDSGVSDLSLHVPDAPSGDYVTRDLPLVVPNATTSAGLLAGDGSLATVDTATAVPQGDARPEDAADLASDVDVVPLADGDAADAEAPLPVQERPAAEPEPLAPQRPVAATGPEPEAPAPARPEPPKPEPAAAPARLPAATAGGDYAVNFGAYGSRADAGAVVNRLRQSNLPAYVEETRVGDRDAWRVRIGPYASRADAESARVRAGSIGSRATAAVVALDAAAPAASGSSAAASRPAASAAAPPAAAPTPASTAAAGTGFAVQLGAYGNASEANALRDRLRAAGIGAFTDTVQTDKGTLTRVKAGPVVTRAEAEQLKARVKSSFNIDGLVRSHP
ncbi:SPOR domain-containing protein [Luteimonas changyuni]|uniref:SPOR domain-containing protein n=1 Tax=Luteimonas sp. MJ145 TaxID=3129234 RepID=UPI0031BB951C